MLKSKILTKKELEVIRKRLNNRKLNQQDSNRLSKQVRPKLKEMASINSKELLNKLEYKPKIRAIEKKIIRIIRENIPELDSIILYGSAIQTNYSEYKDIDLLILTKKKVWENRWQKGDLLTYLENKAKEQGLRLDIQILDIQTFKAVYPSNPSLIYQMKNSKVIYGKLNLPKKIEVPKINLKMKLDWSEIDSSKPSGSEIYNCIRNTLLVRLILNKIIDNFYLSNYLIEELGKNLITRLKENKATEIEKKMAISYLNRINEETLNKINEAKWEKIVI